MKCKFLHAEKRTKMKLSKQFDSRVDNVANFKVSENMSFAYPHVL